MDILNDPTLIFRKRQGTTNKGSEYENLTIANLTISLLTDVTVRDFKLSSNDADFGAFDDVVLEIDLANGDVERYAIQIKHSNDQKILTKKSLTERSGHFSLTKYLTDSRKSSTGHVNLCLYTNRNFDTSDTKTNDGRVVKSDKNVKIDDFQLTIDEIANDRFNGGRCYRFLSDPRDVFFDNFRLLTNQVDIDAIKDNIEAYFRRFGCHDYCHKAYIEFVTEWCNREGKKTKLCKRLMTRKMCLIMLAGSVHPLTIGGGIPTPEMVLLRRTIMSQTLSFGHNVKHILLNLWRDYNPDIEKVSKLSYMYQTKDIHILLWLIGECPLFVTRTPATAAALSLCPDMNFAIFDDPQKLSNSKLSNRVLTTLKCTVQGKETTLDRFLGPGGLIDVLTTDDLVKMTISDFTIGEIEALPFSHIERSVTRHIFDLTILDMIDFGSNRDDFVVITNYQYCQNVKYDILNSEDFLSVEKYNWECGKVKVIFVTDHEYTRNEFDKICFLNPGKKHHHQFRWSSNGLEWVRSTGGVDHLSSFVLTSYMSESKLSDFEDDNSINVVCAGPGMGKTTLMKSLKNNRSTRLWSVIICARNYCGRLTDPSTFVAYLLSEMDISVRRIVEILIRENRVRLIWDGLDEVSDQNLISILNMIEEFDNKGMIQWITARDHLKPMLERRFGVLSRTIAEFDDEEQKRYVQKSLGCPRDTLDDVFEKIKTNIQLFPDNDILGNPLQIFLLTELLRRDRTAYQDLLDKNLFSIADLYEHFVDEKFNIYCQEKENAVDRNDLFEERNRFFKIDRIDLYEKLAIQNFDFDFDNNARLSLVKDPIGFVVDVRHGTVEFVHASFLEYFAACFLSKNHEFVVKIKDFLSNGRYNNVRFFFDLLLAKNRRAHIAVLYRNVRLLKSCACQELRYRDGAGRNALQLACSWGQKYEFLSVEVIDYGLAGLIDDKVYEIDDDDIRTKICHDSEEYCQIVDFLTPICDRTEVDDLYRMTALSYAYKSLCLMTFAKLSRPYKVNFKDFVNSDELCSIIYYCVVLDFPEIFEIVKNMVTITTVSVPDLSYLAVTCNAIGCVKYLTEVHGYDHMLLMVASRRGFVDIVKFFIDAGNDVDERDDHGKSAMMAACKNGHYSVVKLLIDSGASIDDCSLHISVKNQHFDILELLLDSGSDVNAVDAKGNTILQIATGRFYFDNFDALKYLIPKCSNVNVQDILYGTLLHRYCHELCLDVVKLLLDNGADPNIPDDRRRTPLHTACAHDCYILVKLLIDNNATVNPTSDDGKIPLHLTKKSDIVQLLIDNHADLTISDNFGNTPLHFMAYSRRLESVRLLLRAGIPVNCQNKCGDAPLHVACRNGSLRIVKMLIDSGADVNLAAAHGNTPLHCGCQSDELDVVRLLLDSGADVHARNWYGEMAVHWGSEHGNYEIVECLLDNGADVNAVTLYEEKPLDLARDDDVVRVLAGRGGEKFEKCQGVRVDDV